MILVIFSAGLSFIFLAKKSIKSYEFKDESLFIVLKTGQGSDIPALRADVLMNIIMPDEIFEITRTKFLTESLHEL